MTEADRLERLMGLAQESKKYGSMSQVLEKEYLERERDFSDLTDSLRKAETDQASNYEKLHFSYGL